MPRPTEAIEVFERHRYVNAPRRGMDGVQKYVGETGRTAYVSLNQMYSANW